uniref:Uncharacterized protein n=1 Tax=Amblyomma parvum TaxID=251391 RepID=A0A023FYM0_AMBPA
MAASVVSVQRRATSFLLCVGRRSSRPVTTTFAREPKLRFLSQDSNETNRLTQSRTNAFDKWILALYRKYPKGQVPDFAPSSVIEKTRNKARIHLNLILAALTLFGAYIAASWGRRRQQRGESATQMNLDWHARQKSS